MKRIISPIKVFAVVNAWRVKEFFRLRAESAKGKTGDSRADKKTFAKIQRLLPNLQYYNDSAIGPIQNRAKEVGFTDLESYYRFLLENGEEREQLKTRFTYQSETFFRGNDWGFFSERCLSSFVGCGSVHAWSAACANGQEVYSLILALSEYVPLEKIRVLASDYDDRMLENCMTARYPTFTLKQIPRKFRRYALDLGGGLHPRFTFKDELKDRIYTQNINLLTDPFPEGFDVILCRNVLKFFTPEKIGEVQKKLADSLKPGGFLFVSTDGENNTKELIGDPGALGLQQIDGRCVYQKIKVYETAGEKDMGSERGE